MIINEKVIELATKLHFENDDLTIRECINIAHSEQLKRDVISLYPSQLMKDYIDNDIISTKKAYENINSNTNNHLSICGRLNKTYAEKNKRYGDSFTESINRYGDKSILTRLLDKFTRVETILLNDYDELDESVEDTLLDLANYCIMSVMYFENKGVENEDDR